jgi:hypothetical protein
MTTADRKRGEGDAAQSRTLLLLYFCHCIAGDLKDCLYAKISGQLRYEEAKKLPYLITVLGRETYSICAVCSVLVKH